MDEDVIYRSIFDHTLDGLMVIDLETQRVVEANSAACQMYGYSHAEFIGMNQAEIVDFEQRQANAAYLHSVGQSSGREARFVHLRSDGVQLEVELHSTGFDHANRPCVLSVIQDISERVQTERRLQSRMERRAREQAILLEISQNLASALELQPGLILDQLRGIIEFTHAGLFVRQDVSLEAVALRGRFELEPGMTLQMRSDHPQMQAALMNPIQPTRIGNIWTEEPAPAGFRSLVNARPEGVFGEVRSWMWVPLAAKRRTMGVVGVGHTEVDYYTTQDASLALTVANQAAIAMVNADLYEHARVLAALEERQRLARNLHDAVNQSLFSAGLIAEVLPRVWELDPAEGRRSVDDLRRLTRGAQADMRLLLAELRPATLTDAELGDLLRLLGNALEGRTNIPVHLMIMGQETWHRRGNFQSGLPSGKSDGLPGDVQTALYRVCQECLNNIAKHARASSVDIQLRYQPGAVELSIQDDGVGFDPEQTTPGHYGLGMMREHAGAARAELSIRSQPGQGALIMIRWEDPHEL